VKGLNTALGAAGLAAFLALGEVVPRVGIVKEAYFPPTSSIASAFWDELKDGAFWSALGDTLTGWALGLAIAVGAGIVAASCSPSSPTSARRRRRRSSSCARSRRSPSSPSRCCCTAPN
jgi:ABC-type nitrate/sulfonate/bicarbonate transport system permease component